MRKISFSVTPCWIDISERPDLQVLARQEPLENGYSICTWFYANPGKRNMRMGLRVEMRQPVHFVLPLVFKVSECVDQLTTISAYLLTRGVRIVALLHCGKNRSLRRINSEN